MAACLDLTALIVYAIFASGEIQAWAIPPPQDCDNGEEMPMETNERLRKDAESKAQWWFLS